MKIHIGILLTLSFIAINPSHANVEIAVQAPDEDRILGQQIPEVGLWNDQNQSVKLGGQRPIVFLPFYSHCKSTCPLSVSYLKDEAKQVTNQADIVLFSFDPGDSIEDLRDFRKALQVPAGWSILRASPEGIQSVLQSLDLRTMNQGSDFVHSNSLFVLSKDRKIVKLLRGLRYGASDLESAIDDAQKVTHAAATTFPMIFVVGLALVLGGISYHCRNRFRQGIQVIVHDKMSQDSQRMSQVSLLSQVKGAEKGAWGLQSNSGKREA